MKKPISLPLTMKIKSRSLLLSGKKPTNPCSSGLIKHPPQSQNESFLSLLLRNGTEESCQFFARFGYEIKEGYRFRPDQSKIVDFG